MFQAKAKVPLKVVIVALSLIVASSATTCTLKTESSSSCGVIGHIKVEYRQDWDLGLPQIVENQTACATLCARRRYNAKKGNTGNYLCRSFQYEEQTGLCQLSSLLVEDTIVARPNSPKFYYDVDCFDCGSYCRQPYGSNVLNNGDFQQPLFGPWDVYPNGRIRRNSAGNKYYYGSIKGNYDFPDLELSQGFNLCYDRAYGIEFDYLVISNLSEPQFGIKLYAPGPIISLTPHINLPGNQAWNSVRTSFTKRSRDSAYEDFTNPQLYLSLEQYYEHNTTQDIYLDNFKIFRIPVDPPLAPGERNMFRNGDFESGKLAPFKYTNSDYKYKLTSPGLYGSQYGLRYNFHSGQDETGSLSQKLSAKAGSHYMLSYQIQFGTSSSTPVIGQLVTYMMINTPGYQLQDEVAYEVGYSNYSIPIKAQGDELEFSFDAYAEVYDISYEDFADLYFTLDNFKLVEIAKSEFYN